MNCIGTRPTKDKQQEIRMFSRRRSTQANLLLCPFGLLIPFASLFTSIFSYLAIGVFFEFLCYLGPEIFA